MAKNRPGVDSNTYFVQGNEACVFGAINAGCNFFAGYPITPSTEIAEGMARHLPRLGGTFIQMEDEISSMGAIIGASAAGAVAMTATSGPGFSLMQENLGYAYMTQIPIVIVNVQRGGPSTGLPTKLSQSDTMQVRWGTHGDYTAIVLTPASVQEVYDLTMRAFRIAEKFSTPVILLIDKMIGHMREKLLINRDEEQVKRSLPEMPPEWYAPYKSALDMVSHPAPLGKGFRYNITGLVHDQSGFPTTVDVEVKTRLDGLRNKIELHSQEIWGHDEYHTGDAKYLVVSYGSGSRAARGAVETLRNKRVKAGLVDLKTLWPFPYIPLKKIAEIAGTKSVFVVENNMGQLVHTVRETFPHTIPVHGIHRYDGTPLDPYQIVDIIKENMYA